MNAPVQTTQPACKKCVKKYKMQAGHWVLFAFTLFWAIATFVYSFLGLTGVNPEQKSLAQSTKKVILSHNFYLSLNLFITFSFGAALFGYLTGSPNKSCDCKTDFAVSDFQMTLLGIVAFAPFVLLVFSKVNYFWEEPLLKKLCGKEERTLQLMINQKIVFWTQIVCILCIACLVAFLVSFFYKPEVVWEKSQVENFFFEVSPERKKCLEEQVSRKNFGKPRSCSCCGRGTVGGIPPNYDQWLNVDQDTGSRWHRPDNVNYVNTFSNGEEATCNNCGPPSYKMYV